MLSGVQYQDAGEYRCEIHKGGNVLDELTHTLQVFRKCCNFVIIRLQGRGKTEHWNPMTQGFQISI